MCDDFLYNDLLDETGYGGFFLHVQVPVEWRLSDFLFWTWDRTTMFRARVVIEIICGFWVTILEECDLIHFDIQF